LRGEPFSLTLKNRFLPTLAGKDKATGTGRPRKEKDEKEKQGMSLRDDEREEQL